MLKASDIMTTDVVTVQEDTTIEQLAKVFVDRNITGVPVLSADGKLIGMVTEHDLISQNKKLHIPTVMRLFDAFIPLGGSASIEKEIQRMSASTVGEICTRELITISGETSLDEIATIMSEKGVHHLPIVQDGALVGVVDRHDVIEGIAGGQ
jgi:CBS domain-containing protein